VPEYKRILIIRLSSLGDIILTTPFLKILRQNFPDAEIDYCIKSEYKEVLAFNPNINNIIEVDNDLDFPGLKSLRKKLQSNSYDLVFDLHNNLRTFYLKLFLRFKTNLFVFKKYSFRKFLLVKFKLNLMKDVPPIAERYISTLNDLKEINLSQNNLHPEVYTNPEAEKKIDEILNKLKITGEEKLICIVPNAKHFTKTYPAGYYIELINKMGDDYSFLLVGKENDKKVINNIKSGTGKNVYDLCDKLSLLELTALMKKCALVISGDTGPMHIAEAEDIPLIMIAGSSVKEFGFYPQSENSSVIENTGLSCRPCSHIGRESCPKVHFKCMKEIKPEKVLSLMHNFLN
jgi:lipopolysaccharide heptosyltransferase II